MCLEIVVVHVPLIMACNSCSWTATALDSPWAKSRHVASVPFDIAELTPNLRASADSLSRNWHSLMTLVIYSVWVFGALFLSWRTFSKLKSHQIINFRCFIKGTYSWKVVDRNGKCQIQLNSDLLLVTALNALLEPKILNNTNCQDCSSHYKCTM